MLSSAIDEDMIISACSCVVVGVINVAFTDLQAAFPGMYDPMISRALRHDPVLGKHMFWMRRS